MTERSVSQKLGRRGVTRVKVCRVLVAFWNHDIYDVTGIFWLFLMAWDGMGCSFGAGMGKKSVREIHGHSALFFFGLTSSMTLNEDTFFSECI